LLASRLQSAGLQTKLLRHSDILCDGDGGFRRKNEILGNGFLSVSLNVNGSDGNLGKKLVAAGDGDGVVKKKLGLRLRGKPMRLILLSICGLVLLLLWFQELLLRLSRD
ncbi:hypothetical protein Tco_0036642, partial [Tanacetum coccineum]